MNISQPRLQRAEFPELAFKAVLEADRAGLWTALPGIVRKVNLAAMTVEVEATIQARIFAPDGTFEWVNIPILPDVPLVFPGGGGFMLSFPVAIGDECLVVFASRCIDSWWDLGGVRPPTDFRMQDLSDGFALVGPRSRPNVPAGISDSAVQLRNAAGTVVMAVTAAGVSIIGTLTVNGKNVGSTHTHSGVSAGGANSGPPT